MSGQPEQERHRKGRQYSARRQSRTFLRTTSLGFRHLYYLRTLRKRRPTARECHARRRKISAITASPLLLVTTLMLDDRALSAFHPHALLGPPHDSRGLRSQIPPPPLHRHRIKLRGQPDASLSPVCPLAVLLLFLSHRFDLRAA